MCHYDGWRVLHSAVLGLPNVQESCHELVKIAFPKRFHIVEVARWLVQRIVAKHKGSGHCLGVALSGQIVTPGELVPMPQNLVPVLGSTIRYIPCSEKV